MIVLNFDRLALFLCVLIKLTNSELNNKSEVDPKQRTVQSDSKSFGPNFDDEYPQFTPFQDSEFLKIQSEVFNGTNSLSAQEKLEPFRIMVLDAFKKYKSTFLDNNTAEPHMQPVKEDASIGDESVTQQQLNEHVNRFHKDEKLMPNKKRTKKKNPSPRKDHKENEFRYNVGPGVNVSLDMERSVVGVNLDEDCLKDIFVSLARWDDDSDEGRGKKYDMMTKILPLFILPFLIQSAIIPFLVTKLKIMLVKSIIVGKIAIFLLIVSAFRNSQKLSPYEASPAYYLDSPSRRSEVFSGYRVEGRPASWVT